MTKSSLALSRNACSSGAEQLRFRNDESTWIIASTDANHSVGRRKNRSLGVTGMTREEFITHWLLEERAPFIGWDFSCLDGRMIEGQAPWSYSTRAAELMGGATAVIDLDTGGGERFLKLKEHWPAKVVAVSHRTFVALWRPGYRSAPDR
jgi:hypothetical protein